MLKDIDKSADRVSVDSNGFVFKPADDIIDTTLNFIATRTDLVNDFTEGSITRTLVEATSTEIEKLYYYSLENLKEAIDDAVTSAFGFTRNKATYAYGEVTIVLNSILTQPLTVNRGTLFSSSNPVYEQQYRTKDSYQIPKGTQTFNLPVYCTVPGTYGNIPANVIDTVSDLSAIASVTNTQGFMTGKDEESAEDVKLRFRQMIQSLSRGTNQSLIYATESIPDIANAYEYETTYGTVVLYCNDANGDLSEDLQQQVADKVAQYKPAGIQVIVFPTHKTLVSMNVGIQVSDSNLMSDDFLSYVSKLINNYVNGYTIGQPMYYNDIVQMIMDISDYGIVDTKIEAKLYPDLAMTNYPVISDGTILNYEGISIDQQQLTPPDITNNINYGNISTRTATRNFSFSSNWRSAMVVNRDGSKSMSYADLGDSYKTSVNEILRLGLLNVYFITDDDNTVVADGNTL